MRKVVICSVILAAFCFGLSQLLHMGFDRFGFGTGAIIGIGFIVIVISLGFAFDAYERRRRGQQWPQSAPPDRPRLER